ncbi:ABC transporter substrate-binding protein [Vineibacter terrae]|uniref:ABC transporter substrate-binding protein n=1 Tax=Vineibacter terrae TaxID=2586908 RepID=UPI002E321D7D|nr:ABC transporter substrate-binding protein [Vineibacter terrae]HEX2886347.1 ABC transporter substrate-binding protein [Vineibacter terrae]
MPRTSTLCLALSLSLLSGVALAQGAPARGSLTVAFAAEPTVMDPLKYSAGVDHYFMGQMFEQLVRPDPTLRSVNWLAESWKVIEDNGKPIIDIHIRKGVKFHNGDPLTSADFEFVYSKLRDPKISRWSHLQASVERFEIVDDHHFRLHFKEGDGSYISGQLQLWAVPKAYYERVGEEGFAKAPVGTGPWKFVSRVVKDELKLEAFDDYWNKEHRPTVKNLTIKIIPEDLTRVAAFKTGAVDWVDAVPLAMVEEFKKMPGVKTVSVVSGNNLFLDFNTDQPNSPFRDVRVRQAAAHAIDVNAIIKSVLFGQGERYVEVGKGGIGYDPELKPYPFDPKKARELLRQAGHPNGFETPCYNLTTPREPNVKEVGEAMFAYLTAAGIRCKVQGLEYGAWINLMRRGRNGPPEMDGVISMMWSQNLPGDPGTAWAGHLHSFVPGKGWGSYSFAQDAEADAMVEQLKLTMDPQKRDELARKIARYKHEKVLGGLTTYRPMITLAWRDAKVDFKPWPYPGYWRGFQEIGLKQ